MKRFQAKDFLEAFLNLRESATDAQASTAVGAYPVLSYNGECVLVGTRINWKGTIKRAAVDLWDTQENNPDNAPALWENIDYYKGYRIIPEVITVGLLFSKGQCGWWIDGKLYESVVDNNNYTPEQYPPNWKLV